MDHNELRQFYDVIFFSTKATRSPLSLLGGGDYDGDTCTLIWDPPIVESFNNTPLRDGGLCDGDPPDDFLANNFLYTSANLADLCTGDQRTLEEELKKSLATPVDIVVGSYSVMYVCYLVKFYLTLS